MLKGLVRRPAKLGQEQCFLKGFRILAEKKTTFEKWILAEKNADFLIFSGKQRMIINQRFSLSSGPRRAPPNILTTFLVLPIVFVFILINFETEKHCNYSPQNFDASRLFFG